MGRNKKIYSRCTFTFENKLRRQGFSLVAGVDEVGRGALCGPVVAAAVMFAVRPKVSGINDSKKLAPVRRELLKSKILKAALSWGVGIVSAEEIDRVNIHQATLKAMRIALEQLAPKPDFVLFDGTRVNGILTANLNVVKGDARCITIAAASIIAKVTRDYLMQSYASMYPMYDWQNNKGYSCKSHFDTLRQFGVTSLHRRSFRPVYADGQLSLIEGEELQQAVTL
ncbi:MAG TPA: ribonuclease HII [Acidobacteriota bacterium]